MNGFGDLALGAVSGLKFGVVVLTDRNLRVPFLRDLGIEHQMLLLFLICIRRA